MFLLAAHTYLWLVKRGYRWVNKPCFDWAKGLWRSLWHPVNTRSREITFSWGICEYKYTIFYCLTNVSYNNPLPLRGYQMLMNNSSWCSALWRITGNVLKYLQILWITWHVHFRMRNTNIPSISFWENKWFNNDHLKKEFVICLTYILGLQRNKSKNNFLK